MSNVTFNAITSASEGAGNFVASTMSNTDGTGNFDKLIAAVNSHALNSDNYGTGASGFARSHISGEQIGSALINDDAVVKGKFWSGAVREIHMNYTASDNGVRCIMVGRGSSATTPSLPQNGVRMGVFSKAVTFVHSNTTSGGANSTNHYSVSAHIDFNSDTAYGSAAFTATPVLAAKPLISHGHSNIWGPRGICVSNLNSAGCDVMWGGYAQILLTHSATIFIQAIGAGA